MILEILKYPDPELKKISTPVEKFDKHLHKLLDNMAETMYSANGIGLAAIQVGEPLRLFVIDLGADEDHEKKLYEFINPKISKGMGTLVYEEGCLSVPGIAEEVKRKETIHLEYQDRHGKQHELDAEGLLAVAIQHENDHLDGIIFVDRLSPLKRSIVRRKLAKVVTL